MRVLVTGANGFLGRHVVAQLGSRAISGVRARRASQGANESFVELDLENHTSIAAAFAHTQVSAVVHCAAYGLDPSARDPLRAVATNVSGTLALYRAARACGIRRFIHVGSCFELGSDRARQDEHAPLRPFGLYGATKAAASTILREHARDTDFPPVIVRPFAMVGAGERPGKLVPELVRAARSKQALELTPGEEVRDYVSVEFVAEVLSCLTRLDDERFPFGETFHLCSGRGRRVRDFVSTLARALGLDEALLLFDTRASRTDVPRNVIGDPSHWRAFASSLGAGHAPCAAPPYDEMITRLAKRLRAGEDTL